MEENKSITLLTKGVKVIEQYIIKTLIGLMSLLLILATIQLGYYVIKSIIDSQTFVIDLDVLMDLFGVFLLVLIGIELLDTIKVYFRKHDIHVEVVLLVALIAIARKVILMDFEKYSGLEIIGIGAVIIALSVGYYLIKKAGGCGFWPTEKEIVKNVVFEETEFDEDGETKSVERKKTLNQKTQETIEEPKIDPATDMLTRKPIKKKKIRKTNK